MGKRTMSSQIMRPSGKISSGNEGVTCRTLSGQKGHHASVPAMSFSKSGLSHLSAMKWQILEFLPVSGSFRISLGMDLRAMLFLGSRMMVSFWITSNFMGPPFRSSQEMLIYHFTIYQSNSLRESVAQRIRQGTLYIVARLMYATSEALGSWLSPCRFPKTREPPD